MSGLALTPSYAAIGVAAPVLVVLFRLVQGFALGGEVGPSTAFLMEAAPADKRGLYVSLQFATQQAATLVAGIVGVVLANLLTPAAPVGLGLARGHAVGRLCRAAGPGDPAPLAGDAGAACRFLSDGADLTRRSDKGC